MTFLYKIPNANNGNSARLWKLTKWTRSHVESFKKGTNSFFSQNHIVKWKKFGTAKIWPTSNPTGKLFVREVTNISATLEQIHNFSGRMELFHFVRQAQKRYAHHDSADS